MRFYPMKGGVEGGLLLVLEGGDRRVIEIKRTLLTKRSQSFEGRI